MKTIILLLSAISFLLADQYTFLVDKYDKEIELEAKIILKIAAASTKSEVKLFVPEASNIDRAVYSRFFTLVDSCIDANFIYIKNNFKVNSSCENKIHKKVFFTNNYKKLLNNDEYIGAFFWNKSRPNIIFVKERLSKNNIKLPLEYEKFIEDIK